jgi:hypothetical protein
MCLRSCLAVLGDMDWGSLISDAANGDTKQRLAVLPALQVLAVRGVVVGVSQKKGEEEGERGGGCLGHFMYVLCSDFPVAGSGLC